MSIKKYIIGIIILLILNCLIYQINYFPSGSVKEVQFSEKLIGFDNNTVDGVEWTNWSKLRDIDLSLTGRVLGDIESHMPEGHIYRDEDRITWGHETTHGINSSIRNHRFSSITSRINGFYCLDDRAAVIIEPPVTIREAAVWVPESLRGDVYQLYMVNQAESWDDTPLYIFDEWVAYTNGSEVRKDLKIESRAETVLYMMEFNIYAIALAKAVKDKGNYNDKQFRSFMIWNIERSVKIYNNEIAASEYLNKFRTSRDAENLRSFAREYFGKEWCKIILNI